MPANQVDAMKPIGATPRTYDPEIVPVTNLIRQLAARRDIAYISVKKAGFSLELSAGSAGDAGA